MTGKLVTRNKKVAFYGVPSADGTIEFKRMKNFTAMSKTSNPKEYARTYVDELAEVTDVTAYSPSIAYTFDQYAGNEVHDDIIKITNEELVGDDAVRQILLVDFTQNGKAEGTKKAILRNYCIVPDTEGDSTDAYTYTGNFKNKSEAKEVEVTTADEWLSCTLAV